MVDFWDTEATILRSLAAIRNGDGPPPETRDRGPLTDEEWYDLAVKATGPLRFDDEVKRLWIEPYFYDLSPGRIQLGIGIGMGGTFVAVLTGLGSELDKRLSGGSASPADYVAGYRHRYVYGHDFNPFQKLPPGFLYMGEDVGGRSLISLI